MKRLSKGSVLISLYDEMLSNVLEKYFNRKNFTTFVAIKKTEIEKTIKENAINHAIFAYDENIIDSIEKAKLVFSFDNHTIVFFLCDNLQQRNEIKQINPLFEIIMRPFTMRNFSNKMLLTSRQLESKHNEITKYQIGDFIFDFVDSTLVNTEDDSKTKRHLSPKEKGILYLMCQNVGKIVSKHRFIMNLWRKDDNLKSRSLDVYITKLRSYLSSDNKIKIINKHGIGYMLKIIED